MFEDFELSKYMNQPPPSDSSFETMQEVKELTRIPINKKFVFIMFSLLFDMPHHKFHLSFYEDIYF